MTRFYGGLIVAQDCGQKVLKLLLPAESGLLHCLMFFDSSGIRYIRGRGKNNEDEEKLGVGSCTQLLLIIALSWKLHLHTCRIRPTIVVKVLRRLSPFLPFPPPLLFFIFHFIFPVLRSVKFSKNDDRNWNNFQRQYIQILQDVFSFVNRSIK